MVNLLLYSDGTDVVGTSAASIGSAVIFENGETKTLAQHLTALIIKLSLQQGDGSTLITAQRKWNSGTSISFEPLWFLRVLMLAILIYDTNAKIVILWERGNVNMAQLLLEPLVEQALVLVVLIRFIAVDIVPEITAVYDANAQKSVVAYQAGNDAHGYALVGTVSGTSISFGSQTEFENAVVSDIGISFDSSANKVLFYRDHGNSGYGTAIVGTVPLAPQLALVVLIHLKQVLFGTQKMFMTQVTIKLTFFTPGWWRF